MSYDYEASNHRAEARSYEKLWGDQATALLVGRTIKEVRYFTEKEREDLGWHSRPIALLLDDGTWLWPSRDDEGNDAGALFTTDDELMTIPVIP